MHQGNGKQKRYSMAKFHELLVNARGRGLPGKLAELGALCVGIGAGIWAAQHGRMIIGSALSMFFFYSIVLQIFSRLIFLCLCIITLPAYNIYKNHKQNSGWHEEKNQNGFERKNAYHNNNEHTSYDYHSQFYQNKKYERHGNYEQESSSRDSENDAPGYTSDMTAEEARALFGLDEAYTIEELKAAWYREIKKFHPDQNINGNQKEATEEMSKKVNLAYSILKNR